MIQVQIGISVPGNDNNHVTVDILEREDANDREREMARNIQDLLLGVMEMVRDQNPPGAVTIEIIEKPLFLWVCARCGKPLDNVSPGYSIVAGGAPVCANCLRPEEEIARARSI